ncbi:MAG: TIGR01777 family oxidoreductase [Verrucomicrobia bacterium]|nr:TIGR01777 family oxidoreductase [Verrucomicrobiota bacterium]
MNVDLPGDSIFERSVSLPASAAAAFAWHEAPGALERLTPPWEKVRVVARSGTGLQTGARVTLENRLGPFRLRWEAEHRDYVPGRLFRDVALRGPFARWDHRHEFTDLVGGGCELRDRIAYALPGGAAGRLFGGAWVREKLRALFAYRQAVTRDDLRFAQDHAGAPALRVLVTGASGLVGRALVPFLQTQGHTVVRLVRHAPRGPDEVFWNPEAGEAGLDLEAAGEFDAVVHLAGAGIADARWTPARKRLIRESRVAGTRLLAEALAAKARPPRVVVGGSAIGYYGGGGEAWLDEQSPAGAGFLAGVTQAWEQAWAPLDAAGTRRVYLRTGVVLSPAGGALAKMLTPFRLGLGGPAGTGDQWWSWISIDDLVGAIGHALSTPGVRGPLNAVAPVPVTSRDFAHGLGKVLGRPAILPLPASVLRLALGELADEALLASQRVRPGVLRESGYRFRHENLADALRHLLGRVA